MSNQELYIDKVYHFDPEKTLADDDVPVEADELLLQIDYDYERDPAAHFQQVADASRPPAVRGGAPYAIFTEYGASRDTALVATLPYCNPVIPDTMFGEEIAAALQQGSVKGYDSNTWNNGEKHLFLFQMMKALGVRDENGDVIPVITIGADSQDYVPELSRTDKRDLRQGNLGVYTRNAQDILDHEGFGRLHVTGYSQGGSVAHEFLARSQNFDIDGAVIAEAPTYKSRSIAELAKNYLLNKPVPEGKADEDGDTKWTADGPQSRKDLEKIPNRSFNTMARSIALKGAWRTAFGLSHGTMLSDIGIAESIHGLFPLAIAWNETSSLTYDIEQSLFTRRADQRMVLEPFKRADMLRAVKAVGPEGVGAPHLAGESPMYYALMIGESVLWATQRA